MKKFVGYINLYKGAFCSNDLLHWSGSLYKTKEEALRYKDRYKRIDKNYFIGEVFIKTEEEVKFPYIEIIEEGKG